VGLPALVGWAFFICGGGRGGYGWGERTIGGLADGGREGGFYFGGSYGLKALHFEK